MPKHVSGKSNQAGGKGFVNRPSFHGVFQTEFDNAHLFSQRNIATLFTKMDFKMMYVAIIGLRDKGPPYA
jgi:hypothetical protein